MRKVDNIHDARLETEEQETIRRIANEAASRARLGQVSAIAVITLLNGKDATGGAYGGTRAQRMALIGELEALKARLLAEE